MIMRSSNQMIQRISHWLQYFTLVELLFVLKEDTRMYCFDRLREKKIGRALRYKFGSDCSDDDVKIVIMELANYYKQMLPVITDISIQSILIHHDNHLLIPFQSTCPVCHAILDKNDCEQKRIRLYCRNGSVVTGA